MHERVSSDPLNVFVVVNIKEREFVRLINQKSPSKDRNYVLVDAKGEDVIQDDIPNTYQFNQDALFLQQMRSGLQGSFFMNSIMPIIWLTIRSWKLPMIGFS